MFPALHAAHFFIVKSGAECDSISAYIHRKGGY